VSSANKNINEQKKQISGEAELSPANMDGYWHGLERENKHPLRCTSLRMLDQKSPQK